jgi:hypothetical protein
MANKHILCVNKYRALTSSRCSKSLTFALFLSTLLANPDRNLECELAFNEKEKKNINGKMPYPTKAYIRSLLDSVENGDGVAFWSQVSPDVDWIVMGTHPAAGHYHSLDELLENTFHRLQSYMRELKLNVRSLMVDEDWSTLELEARGVCKNG